ncbi:hypothetical protein GOBAR_AA29907 [Gossypium barbadense]|uniref:Sm domain-containing protein n=3 Tax=Gossypium TaxID=3633 RepID=A0A2P5WI72_GOSBA|nr:hypothetical protein GOBAR_AA29907 [Gossypium barbadense]
MEQEVGESLIQLGNSDGSNSSSSDPVTRVRKLLFRRMLVGIKDGRFFLGTFHCLDKQGNIILQDTIEYRSTRRSSPSPMEQRCLGLVLIPSSCQNSCHVDCSVEEQLSLLKLGNSDGSNSSSSDPVTRVRKLLFRRMLVGIKDGRFFLGTFHCLDKQGNIILQDTIEYRSTRRSSPSPMEQRCLGLVLIPSSCQNSCHVDCSVEEQLSLLKV